MIYRGSLRMYVDGWVGRGGLRITEGVNEGLLPVLVPGVVLVAAGVPHDFVP